jgi:hypothetical protein
VYRTSRVIGGSVATFDSSNAWGFSRQRVPNSIINKWAIKGLNFSGILQTEGFASASNAFLVAPWEYAASEYSNYLVDDDTWAQDLADWKLSQTNGRKNTVSWSTTPNTQTNVLGSTSTGSDERCGLSSEDVYCVAVKHHADAKTAHSTFTAEFAD